MSVRSFAVFEDLPATPVKATETATTLATKGGVATLGLSVRSALQENVPRLDRTLSLPVTEKENIHPVTGLSSSQPLTKKRKMSVSSENGAPCVLATKMLAIAEPSKAKRPELKQRKASSGPIREKGRAKATGLTRSKSTADGRRVFGSSANTVGAPSGSAPVLAAAAKPRKLSRSFSQPSVLARSSSKLLESVPEHDDFSTLYEMDDEVNQAVINSRCRDLTVLPLADVSVAYLQSGGSSAHVVDENDTEVRRVKEKKSFESRMRDFTPSSSYSSIPSASSASSVHSPSSTQQDDGFTVYEDEAPSSPKSTSIESKSTEAVKSPAALSTPERRGLYSLFTFSSPVGSPERFQ
ncbi:hypothetical protein SCHPADRAFT_928944 [Schizopora paradoxa]|uniref:Uncharacterized protein n=1 Tax=Schizopora paradoxa TaxID=27342 RepID=A0A0H2RLV6_9AGAM|nr:hypothetical protein SCHPADRAFT_928944 [Schizopora paradoxa]